MRVSQVEMRARKSIPAMLADLDEAKPEATYTASVAIRHAGVPQFCIRLPIQIWKKIGAPPYVDFVGRATEGLKIVPGRNTKVSRETRSSVSVTLAVSTNKVGLSRKPQKATQVEISAEKSCIYLDAVPAAWDIEPDKPIKAPPPPPRRILEDETPAPPAEPAAEPAHVKMAVRRAGSNGTGLVFTVPSKLLGQIGDPEHLLIEGTPHHGFTFFPRNDGLKLNYKTGKNLYITTGLGTRNISKKHRLPTTLDAEVKDGVIKIGGACREWINCEGAFRPEPEAPLAAREVHLAGNPASGTLPVNGNGNGHHAPAAAISTAMPKLPTGNTPIEMETVKTMFQQSLNTTRALKEELERRTGLKFRVTKDLRFVLDV